MPASGKIALVTGGSRGVGRGIAQGLAEIGATVYLTGRTSSEAAAPPPGTVEHAAREVDRLGGRGIPVRCDHADDAQVRALFERIAREAGRLDLLVNNAHSGVGDIAAGVGKRFWELETATWDRMNGVGLRGHYVASVYAARMMVPQRSGLIVNISSFGSLGYLFNAAYGTGKAALDRLTADLAAELRPEGVAVVSLWPGFVWTEVTGTIVDDATPGYRRVLDAYGESPIVAGRAAAALVSDPKILRKTGTVQIAAEVARRHGLADETGRRPLSPRSLRRFARAILPPPWTRLAALAPPTTVPFWVIPPILARFSAILKERGGYRTSDAPPPSE